MKWIEPSGLSHRLQAAHAVPHRRRTWLYGGGPWKEPIKERRPTRRDETRQKQDTRRTRATTGRPRSTTTRNRTGRGKTKRRRRRPQQSRRGKGERGRERERGRRGERAGAGKLWPRVGGTSQHDPIARTSPGPCRRIVPRDHPARNPPKLSSISRTSRQWTRNRPGAQAKSHDHGKGELR